MMDLCKEVQTSKPLEDLSISELNPGVLSSPLEAWAPVRAFNEKCTFWENAL